MILRRKRLPAELDEALSAFTAVLAEVEPGKAALTEVMPTTRLPGRPLAEALSVFEEHLARADELMVGWRRRELAGAWDACEAGIAEARRRAAELRTDAPDLGGFEGLVWAVGELIAPLEAFEGAARRFHELRV
jgi:hypothetical protein